MLSRWEKQVNNSTYITTQYKYMCAMKEAKKRNISL